MDWAKCAIRRCMCNNDQRRQCTLASHAATGMLSCQANATLLLAEAKSFNRQQLTISDRLTLESLVFNLQMFIEGYQYRR
jgi:hypothetical protein